MFVKHFHIVGCEKEFQYEVSQIIRLFIEPGVLAFGERIKLEKDQLCIWWRKTDFLDSIQYQCSLFEGLNELWVSTEIIPVDGNEKVNIRECKRGRLRLLWKALSFYTGNKPPWGLLTGVRPVKVAHEMIESVSDQHKIPTLLQKKYCLRADKAQLILDVAYKEQKFIKNSSGEAYSLYFAIPFCPTRCTYCSFPAYTGPGKLKKLDAYIDTIIEEAAICAQYLKDRPVESVYIGGGTPTVLSASQLERLQGQIVKLFNLSELKEYTVEAGRPDTITEDKLQVLKKYKVNRVCVNPQTFCDSTLERIGRRHTAEDIIKCIDMIRNYKFNTLNMDLILGLPGETAEDVKYTLQQLKSVKPENVTVHTLALKKGSALRMDEREVEEDILKMETMVDMAYHHAIDMGLEPYYMYRQKFMLANLENVGYSKDGHECIYNMQIMEERQDILSFGAGGVSKVCFPSENRHERIPNVRGLEEYLERYREMAERKVKMLMSK